MQLRRALLIFAAVLGVAAIAASFVPSPEPRTPPAERPAAEAAPAGVRPVAPEPLELRFDAGTENPARRTVAPGRQVIVQVAVDTPGEVDLPGLGRTGFAVPGTPAVFDLLLERAGRYEITITPISDERRRVGLLVVAPPRP